MATVSVVIPSYNRGHCIRACLESVLKQTFQDFEIIVVDDASKDDTQAQVAQVPDARIRYIRHETNKGGGGARNTGIRAASGEFVAFLDSDDTWTVDKLERQIAQIRECGPDVGMSYTWFICIDSQGQERWRMDRVIEGLANPVLLEANWIGTFSGIVIRRDVLDRVGGMDEQMRSCQDWDLFVRVNAFTAICCCPHFLVYYLDNASDQFRISSNSASVLAGHRRMLDKMRERLAAAPQTSRFGAFKRFAEVFASVGEVADTMRASLAAVGAKPSASHLLWALHMIVRALRKKLS